MSVDLSKILANAKNLMNAEDTGRVNTQHTKGRANSLPKGYEMYDEDYEPQVRQNQQRSLHPSGLNIAEGASKLPKEIRDSILNNPTPSEHEMMLMLDPVAKAEHDLMLEQNRQRNVNRQTTQRNDDMIMVSKSELKAMMLETLLEIMPKITSNIEETTIKKTIQCVIKENKEKKGRL